MLRSLAKILSIALILVFVVAGISNAVDKVKSEKTAQKSEMSKVVPNTGTTPNELTVPSDTQVKAQAKAAKMAAEANANRVSDPREEEAKRAYTRMLEGNERWGDKALIEEYFPVDQAPVRETNNLDDNGGVWFSWTGNEPFVDSGCSTSEYVEAPITVSGVGGNLLDVEVRIDNITHTFDGDLEIFLVGPNAVELELCNDIGGSGENFINTVFNDEATTPISEGSAPFTGEFIPLNPLSTFNGINPNGTWTLKICDDAGADLGTLNGWSIQVLAPAGITHDFNTMSVSSPVAGFRYDPSDVVPVTAMFRNLGTTTEAAPVRYMFNNGPTDAGMTSVLEQFDTEQITFANSITLPATDGTYILKVWTDLATDGDRVNDTMAVNVWVMDCARPVPWSENFDGITPPELPACWAIENTDGENPVWVTSATNSNSPPNCAYLSWRNPDVNDWMFTPGLNLTSGTTYTLVYSYRARSTTWFEDMEVMYGTAQNSAAMTNTIQSTFSFNQTDYIQEVITFTPATTDIYYIGWHVTSQDAFGVYIDDVGVSVGDPVGRCCYGDPTAPSCADETRDECMARTDYLSWTFGANCTDDPCPILEEGENCVYPFALTVPGTFTGATVDFMDDYHVNGNTAPDVAFEYTPTEDQQVTFSLCDGTDYDSYLYVYEGVCEGDPIAFSDDNCGGTLQSHLECVPLTANTTYFVIVDGIGSVSGSYTLTSEACVPCPAECPPGGVDEGEADCFDGFVDATNGGCNSDPHVWGEINCNETVCGTVGNYMNGTIQTRDTDWYVLNLTEPSNITWKVTGDFPALAFILEPGPDDPCDGIVQLGSASVARCDTAIVTAFELNPGEYWLWAGPSVFAGVPCGTPYTGVLTCEEYIPPIGRCCYNGGASCVDSIPEFECIDTYNGRWTEGLDCTTPCPPTPPCDIAFSDCEVGADDYISNVTLGDINNETTYEPCPDSYGDYTGITTEVSPGESYDISVSVMTPDGFTYSQCVNVWFDWNHDDTWDADATLQLDCLTPPDISTPAVFTGTVNVPADAVNGMTYMRVVEKYSSAEPDGCTGGSYGEAEDYLLQVGPSSDISGIVRRVITNAPIEGAQVWTTDNPGEIATTNAAGEYTLGCEPGTWTVHVHAQGYCDVDDPNVVVEEGASTTRFYTLDFPDGDVSNTSVNLQTPVGVDVTGEFDVLNGNNATCELEYTVSADVNWVAFSPEDGTVDASSSETIDVIVNASTLSEGDHTATITVESNDEDSPFEIDLIVVVGEAVGDQGFIPTEFAFYQNYPNPFNATTALQFDIPVESAVNISIYNVMGQLVDTPVNANYPAGRFKIMYTADALPSGMYLVKMSAGDFNSFQKMVLLK